MIMPEEIEIFGSKPVRQIKSHSVHHTNPKYYDEGYNTYALRDFRVYNPQG